MAKNERLVALSARNGVTAFFRVFVPLAIVADIACFIAANILYAAEEKFEVDGPPPSFNISATTVFNFNLGDSVHLMWTSGAKFIASIIAILSGAWPYAKLLSMLFMWFIPGKRSTQTRMLWWLDVLGKWSFIDLFVMVIMTTSFKLSSNMKAFNTPMKIGCEVTDGFYVFMVAAILSLLVTDMMVWLLMYDSDASYDDEYNSLLDSDLSARERSRAKSMGGTRRSLLAMDIAGSSAAKLVRCIAVSAVCIVTGVLGLYGAFVPSFQLHYGGFLFNTTIPNFPIVPSHPSDVNFTIVDLGTKLPSSVWNAGASGVYVITAVYITLAVIIPFIVPVLTLVLWAVPMYPVEQRRIRKALQFFTAWGSIDVMLLGIIAARVELNTLVQGTMSQLPPSVTNLMYGFCNAPADAQCLTPAVDCHSHCLNVDVELMSGFWILLAAIVAYYGLYLYVESCLRSLQTDRMERKRAQSTSRGDAHYAPPSPMSLRDAANPAGDMAYGDNSVSKVNFNI